MALPKKVYVREDVDGDNTYLIAYDNADDVVEDDGPTLVGEYALVGKPVKLKKVVVGS